MKLCLNGTSSFRGHYLTFELSSSTIFVSRSEKKKIEITGDWSGIPRPCFKSYDRAPRPRKFARVTLLLLCNLRSTCLGSHSWEQSLRAGREVRGSMCPWHLPSGPTAGMDMYPTLHVSPVLTGVNGEQSRYRTRIRVLWVTCAVMVLTHE